MNRHATAHLSGTEIRNSREAIGLSRIGLAYKAGVDLRTIERIEAEDVEPRRATLTVIEAAIAEAVSESAA